MPVNRMLGIAVNTDSVILGRSGLSAVLGQTLESAGPPATGNFITSVVGGTPRNDFSGWLGFKFQTGASPGPILSLDRYVLSGNVEAHTQILVNAAGNSILASASAVTLGVTPGDWAKGLLGVPYQPLPNTIYYRLSDERPGSPRDEWLSDDSTVMWSTYGTLIRACYSLQSDGTSPQDDTLLRDTVPLSFTT